MSEFNPSDPFGFFGQFFKPGQANPFMPPLSEEELDRKILECRTVEQWLTMQVGMLQMTVKTLELQKAGLAAFKQGLEPKGHPPDQDA
ncbi:PhaM family polyhydroxyalkanoate granule multifunctional regulatory protein [Chitinolyticbacter meiyuanensis]|uniref:PhaM family polyhydroxyalkanoate granule multifunctional regulatory protein n=1 Tax=Chitinolyticbacter meiyuanensis TaxID=682798 RepID=UPI0011E5DBFD|nr:PhaM family polyhydroxyalkanoate granule multifunctional regulatory protein [Chitinolyticbacter meiyuanensis]